MIKSEHWNYPKLPETTRNLPKLFENKFEKINTWIQATIIVTIKKKKNCLL